MKRRRGSSTSNPTTKQPAKKKKTQKKLTTVQKQAVVVQATQQLRGPTERQISRHKRTVKPKLTFMSSYKGTKTQTLAEEQSIYFQQVAVLGLEGAAAPYDLSAYYDLNQEVKDTFTYEGEAPVTRDWEQDGPYGPPYSNAQTLATKEAIQFTDEPGFSTTNKTAAGKWLVSYDVYFRWKVRDRAADQTWTSPEVHHRVVSPYLGGGDGRVTGTAHRAGNWTVDTLPDRPERL